MGLVNTAIGQDGKMTNLIELEYEDFVPDPLARS